jgi:hypothetical protein
VTCVTLPGALARSLGPASQPFGIRLHGRGLTALYSDAFRYGKDVVL